MSGVGNVVNHCWLEIPKHFPNIKLDEYIIIPNHVYGILIIETSVGIQNFEPLQRINKFQHITLRSLRSMIRGFKIGVTKYCRQNNYESFVWQQSFYDLCIRNEKSLEKIREYILNNPLKYTIDEDDKRHVL